MLQFGQKCIESKDFYQNKRITDTVDHDKIMVSNKILCNKEKDQCFTVGYEDGDKIIPLYIKTPPKVFSYRVQQYLKNSAWKMGCNLKDHEE